MKLFDVLTGVKTQLIEGPTDIDIDDIAYDSRLTKEKTMFVCLKGADNDGNDYIEDAVNNGAVCIVSSQRINLKTSGITTVLVENDRIGLAQMSANLFGHPSKELITIAITGTKGKTTTSCMIKSILDYAGLKAGLIGTLGVVVDDEIIKLNNTTPESYEIQKYLRYMVDKKCKSAVLEASSLGLRENRLTGITFDYGVFTNLSEDHIGGNEHKDMDEYIRSKNMLFKMCKTGIVNADDSYLPRIIDGHNCRLKTFGFSQKSDVFAESCTLSSNHSHIGCNVKLSGDVKTEINVPIPGRFNAYNALAAACICSCIGVSKEDIKKGIENVKVKGRVETVSIPGNFTVIIDYAHNPVSMENILLTLRQYHPTRLVVLFGAGGNRPKVRRYQVGEVVGTLSDFAVVTEDNSRYENVMDIIEDIKKGLDKANAEYVVIPDRKDAINYCIKHAQDGDIILLAGKGHETYKEVKGVKYPFDEREVIREIIKDSSL